MRGERTRRTKTTTDFAAADFLSSVTYTTTTNTYYYNYCCCTANLSFSEIFEKGRSVLIFRRNGQQVAKLGGKRIKRKRNYLLRRSKQQQQPEVTVGRGPNRASFSLYYGGQSLDRRSIYSLSSVDMHSTDSIVVQLHIKQHLDILYRRRCTIDHCQSASS